MSYLALLFCQDEKTARTVTQVLSELEFGVDACAETFAAVKKLTSQPFEAVVVDCQNEESASLLLKAARNSTFNQTSLMVALVEGQTGVAAAYRIGANLVLTKPIAVDQARGTLRVARGLLRKNSTLAPAVVPSSASVPAKPQASASADSTPVKPDAETPAAKIQPGIPSVAASFPFAAAQPDTPTVAPIVAPTLPPRPAPSAPVQPSAFRAVAFANFEQHSENPPAPDSTAADVLESLGSKTQYAPTHSLLAHSTQEVVSVSEVETGANQAVRAALAPKAPLSSQDFAERTQAASQFGSGAYGSAAAAAPAREAEPSPVHAVSAGVNDLFEAPVFGQTSSPEVAHAQPAADTELDFSGSPAPSGSKTPLIAVAAILALAAVLYFGWAQMHKSTPASTPAAGPLQPPPPDFGSAVPTPQPPAPAPSHAAPAIANDSVPVESINRFAHSQQPVAQDRVTAAPTAAAPRNPQPIEVKTQLLRTPASTSTTSPNSSNSSQDSVEAPSIANLGGVAKPTALSAMADTSTTVVPQLQRVSQGVIPATLIKSVQPIYPPQALQMHSQGIVALQATIAKDGSVRDVKPVSGPTVLSRAAIDAVKQWKYKPFTLNGEPVENQVDIKINFAPR